MQSNKGGKESMEKKGKRECWDRERTRKRTE